MSFFNKYYATKYGLYRTYAATDVLIRFLQKPYTDLIRPDAEPRQAFLFFKFTKEIIFDYHWMNWKPIKKNIEINLLI
mgnify:CR=1 FL=1